MVMATPFLLSLRSFHSEIWGLGNRKSLQLYKGLDLFSSILVSEEKGWLDLVFFLRRQGLQRAIVLSHSLRPALLFLLSGVRERIGYDVGGSGLLLTHREIRRHESTVDHYLRLLRPLGLEPKARVPVLKVTEEEEASFRSAHPDVPFQYCAFIVGASFGPSKIWPVEYFSSLASGIVNRFGIPVYLLPGPSEKEIALRIRDLCGQRERVFIKALDVSELKVMIGKARFVVTNDTGPRHIASALSVPAFVLLGPMDERYSAYPSPTTYVLKADVPCRPCNRRTCNRDHACMRRIEPKQVLEKIEEAIGDTF